MKNRSVIPIIIACAFVSLSKAQVKLTVTDIMAKPTYKAFICYRSQGKFYTDSVGMVNGKFHFKESLPETKQRAFVYIAPENSGFLHKPLPKEANTIYLEQGNLTMFLGQYKGDTKIGGSPLNDDYQSLFHAVTPFKEKEAALENSYQEARKANDTDKMEELKQQFLLLEKDKRNAEKNFVKSHPDSEISLEWLMHTIDVANNKEEAEKLFAILSNRLKSSKEGQNYKARLDKTISLSIGQQAPNFTSTTPDGETFSLKSLRGKYVLIAFWASWNKPSREDNPYLMEAYHQFKNKNFEIVGVSLDMQPQSWTDAIAKDESTWLHVSDLKGWNNQVARLYAVRQLPSNFLINPEGKIIAKNVPSETLSQKLSVLLK